MKLGVHAYAWPAQWKRDPGCVLRRIRDLSFDFVEIPLIDDFEALDVETLRKQLESLGLTCCASTVLREDTDISSDELEVRLRGVSYLKRCVELAYRLGAPFVSGVIYGPYAKRDAKPPKQVEWERVAESLREVARYAATLGVSLALEPVNRYETHIVNTAQQALYLRNLIGEPNVFLHLDTYHMNIEEDDVYAAIVAAGPYLIHLHLSESHRGIPGRGQVHWEDVFRALAELRYDRWAALESFEEATDDLQTWTWRKLAPDSETLLVEGRAFIRECMARWGINTSGGNRGGEA